MENVVPNTRSLILQLISAMPDGTSTTAVLQRGVSILGISPNSLRVTLTRLRQEGFVASPRRGVHTIGPRSDAVNSMVMCWRERASLKSTWNQAWVAVHTAGCPKSDRGALRRRLRALSLWGFHELCPELWIRPDNLNGGVSHVRKVLHQLSLEEEAPVFQLSDLEDKQLQRALHLWDGDALEEGYQKCCRRLAESQRQLPSMPLETAAKESFLVGAQAIRRIVFDPLLPEPIGRPAGFFRMVDAMKAYDILGRRLWGEVLEQPLDTHFTSQGAAHGKINPKS